MPLLARITMSKNVIEIFARGNQELFHSAFLAWLMDDQGDHRLGNSFRAELLRRLPPELGYDPEANYSVFTEYRAGGHRFDILLKPESDNLGKKGLVLENKIKSLGDYIQPSKYKDSGYDVAILALLSQTIDDQTRRKFSVINYREICNILDSIIPSESNWHQRLVREYNIFVNAKLTVYEALNDYCNGLTDFTTYAAKVSQIAGNSDLGDNDVRTVCFYYFHTLREHIRLHAPDLCFGSDGYKSAQANNVNTDWLPEKNMQGSPFMEALIFRPFETQPWMLHANFKAMHEREPIVIAPRIEVWLDPRGLTKWLAANEAGTVAAKAERAMGLQATIMLGTWNKEMRAALRQHPYQEVLTPRPGATRNFHSEVLSMEDLPFARMTSRIREMMTKVFDRTEESIAPARAS
jgi:hypothetical protein